MNTSKNNCKKKMNIGNKKKFEKTLVFFHNICGVYAGMYVHMLGWETYLQKVWI